MVGWQDPPGTAHWSCFHDPSCGSKSRPADAPPVSRLPVAGAGWSRTPPAKPPQLPPGPVSPVNAPPTTEWRALGKLFGAVALAVIGIALAVGLYIAVWGSGSGATGGGGPYGPQSNGYEVTCADGWISHSGGRPGACSHHGGIP